MTSGPRLVSLVRIRLVFIARAEDTTRFQSAIRPHVKRIQGAFILFIRLLLLRSGQLSFAFSVVRRNEPDGICRLGRGLGTYRT